jgi:predicted transcriptional regulator
MKLKGKVVLKVVTLRNKFALSLEDRLTYSWLVYRLRFGKGCNKLQLARSLNLDRTKTVPACLQRLTDLGLVELREGRFFAKEAPAEQFSYRTGKEPWYERLNYWYYPLPTRACPLTTRQIAVWSQLQCPNCHPCIAAIASRLCIDRKTVRAALTKLSDFGLVTDKYIATPPSQEQMAWFRDKPVKVRNEPGVNWDKYSDRYEPLVTTLFYHYPEHGWAAIINTVGQLAKAARYSPTRLDALMEQTCQGQHPRLVAKVVLQLPELIRQAEQKYDRDKYATSMGLLHKLVKDFVQSQRKKVVGRDY